MPLYAKEPDSSAGYKLPPEGTHLAICDMVVDLGMQESPFGTKHQCYIRWELPDERIGEEPMTIGKFYTLSLHEMAVLRHDLEGWRGRAFTPAELKQFDIFKLLGVGCQITVVYSLKANGQTGAKVSSVVGWPKGMARKAAEIGILRYSEDEPDQLADLPAFLKAIIDKRIKPLPLPTPAAVEKTIDDLSDEVPF
jgi:hypothetical protein